MKTNIFSPKSILTQLGLAMALMLAATGLRAQDKPVVTDTTEVIVGDRIITITIDSATGRKDVQVTHRAGEPVADGEGDQKDDDKKEVKPVDVNFMGLDLGANWLMYQNGFDLPASQNAFETIPLRSTNLAIHMLPTHFNMAKGHVSLLTAITFDNNKYQFRNNVTMVPNQASVTMVPDSVGFKKNKLSTWYAQIPLMLSFQTKPTEQGKNFHIAFGGFAGLFLGAQTKQKSEEYGKVVRKDDFNLNPLRYGVTARIGYGNLELYSNYTLSSMFRDGQGPSFNNINFGIALTGMM